MVTLANQIEVYLKGLLDSSSSGRIDIRRGEIAEIFTCVPSQINYVLETRFNNRNGYLIESRRGGGGYLRIIRLYTKNDHDLLDMINNMVGQKVSQQNGDALINRLVEEEFLTRREGILVKSMISDTVLKEDNKDNPMLRSKILKSVLINLLREDF